MSTKINTVISSLGLVWRPIQHQLERPLASTSFEMIFTYFFNLVSGTLFLTGITGWLLSYLVVPPAIPGEVVQTGPNTGAG